MLSTIYEIKQDYVYIGIVTNNMSVLNPNNPFIPSTAIMYQIKHLV